MLGFYLFLFFKTGFPFVALADLELCRPAIPELRSLLASAPVSAKIKAVHHHCTASAQLDPSIVVQHMCDPNSLRATLQ